MKRQAYQSPSIKVEAIYETYELLVTSNHTSPGPGAADITPPDVYDYDEEEGN